FLLGRAPDLADEDDSPGLGVFLEEAQGVDEAGPHDRVSPDPQAGALPEPELRGLPDRLVGEGPAAGDDAHLAGAVDVAGHDADLALARCDDPRAVGADETGRV